MENKKIEKEILEAIKEFKIIAYGNDHEIIHKIIDVIRINLINEVEDERNKINSNRDWANGYSGGLGVSIGIINDLLKL